MQNLIKFLELDKDGTWFLVLVTVLVVVLIIFFIAVAKMCIDNYTFHRKYGVKLKDYCKKYDLNYYDLFDRENAFRIAHERKKTERIINNLCKNDFTVKFPRTGISIEEAAAAFKNISDTLSMESIYVVR